MNARTPGYAALLQAVAGNEPPAPEFWILPDDRAKAMDSAITRALLPSELDAEAGWARDELGRLGSGLHALCTAVSGRITHGRSRTDALEQWQVLLARSWSFKYPEEALAAAAERGAKSSHRDAKALPHWLQDIPGARPFVDYPDTHNPLFWWALNPVRRRVLATIPFALRELMTAPGSLNELLCLLAIYTASDVELWEAIVRHRDLLGV